MAHSQALLCHGIWQPVKFTPGICWHKCASAFPHDKCHCFRAAQELIWEDHIVLCCDNVLKLLEPSNRQNLPSPQLANGSSALQRSNSYYLKFL